jgi:preprotein translocase subunit SecA
MDYLKEGIGLRAMAQRDPLVEYQREGFDMFAAMLDSLKEESVGFLYNLQVQVVPAAEQAQPGTAAAGSTVPGAPVVTAASAAATALSNGGANRGAQAPAGAASTPAISTPVAPAASTPAAPVRRRVRPVEPLPTEQAAAAASVGAAVGGPAALRGKGLGGPAATPLTYSGPTEDGGTETRRSGAAAAGQRTATATGSKEPGRNAPCPCGSGKKYKLCHGRPGAN